MVLAKLDENLGLRGAQALRDAGWDIATVWSQRLTSASDATLIDVCRAEHRALVSLDKDFANTLQFPPRRYAGIVVLRMPEPVQADAINHALRRVALPASTRELHGRLWIVTPDRIREFAEPDPS